MQPRGEFFPAGEKFSANLFYGELMKSTAVENVTLVCVEARIWTAVRQLSEADAKQVSQKAKGGIVKPGSLRVFPKAPLAAFSVIKAKAESLLKKEGVRFAGSYVIPNSKLPDVLSRLAVLKSEFEKEICTFLSGYASERSKWIGLNSEYAGLIEKYSLPEAEVQRRFFFKHLHFGLACATASEAASAAGAIADAAIAETARKFGELSACSSEGGNCVAGHTVAAVARLGQKLKTLSSLPAWPGSHRLLKMPSQVCRRKAKSRDFFWKNSAPSASPAPMNLGLKRWFLKLVQSRTKSMNPSL